MLIGPKVPICSKVPISPNIHLYPFPHAHLSQTPICPKCSFTPIAQCPFALVLVFPGAHFPLKPTCPNVHRSQSAHLPQFADLPWFSFFLVCICSKCPFSPNAHLPQCPLLVHRCPLCSKVPICRKYLFALVLIFPGARFPQRPICSQSPLAPMPIGFKSSCLPN